MWKVKVKESTENEQLEGREDWSWNILLPMWKVKVKESTKNEQLEGKEELIMKDYVSDVKSEREYDTVSDVVESKVHQCQQNSDA